MREFLWRARKLSTLFFVLGLMMILGCEQSGSGGNGSQPATLQHGTTETAKTPGETTTSSVGRATTKERTARNGKGSQVDRQEATQSPAQPEKQGNDGARGDRQERKKHPSATVRVAGTEGLSFVGNVGSGQELRQVKGTTPEEYELPLKPGAEIVTASIRKQQPQDGDIKVEVLREGQVVTSEESSGSVGMVNVIWTSQGQGNR